MSTKTSIKRIALVAVSALGFGLLSVVPAKAATGTMTTSAAETVGVVEVGSAFTTLIREVNDTSEAEATHTVTLTRTSSPIGSNATAQASLTGLNFPAGSGGNTNTVTASGDVFTVTVAGTGAAIDDSVAGNVLGTMTFIPDRVGKYVFTLDHSLASPTEGTVTVYAVPAATSSLQATWLQDSTFGAIRKVSDDDTFIGITRPLGTTTTSGLVLGEVVTSADPDFVPGQVLIPGTTTGVTATTDGADLVITLAKGNWNTAGNYSIRFFTDTDGSLTRGTSEASALVSFNYAGAPSAVSVSLSRASIPNVTAASALVATATVTDVFGNPTYSQTSLVFSDDAGAAVVQANDNGGAADANGVRVGLTNSYTKVLDFTASGADTAGDSVKITATDTDVSTATGSASFTVRDSLAATGSKLELTGQSGLYVGTAGTSNFSTVIPAVTTNTAQAVNSETAVKSMTFTFTGTANKVYSVSLTTTGGRDISRYTYPTTITTLADGTATFVVENSAPVASSTNPDTFTVAVSDSIQTTITANNTSAGTAITVGSTAGILVGATSNLSTVTGTVTEITSATSLKMSAATTGGSLSAAAVTFSNKFQYTVTYISNKAFWTLTPGATTKVLQKSTNTVTAKLTDRFGRVVANQPYTVSVSGRNVTSGSGTTDANGVATYTVTDSATSSYDLVLGYPTDTVTFTSVVKLKADGTTDIAASDATGVSFSYVAALPAVSTITVSVPAGDVTIDQVEALPGVPANTATYTATLRLASGAAAGSGLLVTFSGGADDIFVDGISTGVTNALGQASVSVYRQKAGYQTITATAGGVTGNNATPKLWKNTAGTVDAGGTGAGSADARNVRVSAAQTVVGGSAATVIATVTDRWGNPVAGHLVTFSYSGVGRPVSGADATVGTDTNGQAQYQVTALASEFGAMNVTATISGGQTANAAGFVNGTKVAGVTAGNTTATSTVTFTKDTSVSTADALLELAKAIGTGNSANAAADAALEAIDAANAATDAANLAAEAADAATVAAEEARDAADAATAAVEALASEVATLVAALKAQITTLANTVAKIAKRVKA